MGDEKVTIFRDGRIQKVSPSPGLLTKRVDFMGYKCDVCERFPIKNYRWECSVCDDFDMCNPCLKTGKGPRAHSHGHQFVRFKVDEGSWEEADGVNAKPLPKLTHSTSVRLQMNEGIMASTTTLKDELATFGIQLPNKKFHQKKSETCLRIFETGLDAYEISLAEDGLKEAATKGVPTLVKRMLMHNSLVLSSITTCCYYESLSSSDDAPGAVCPFAGPYVRATLLAVLQQIKYRDDDLYGWFSAPVPKSVPKYYDTIAFPSDLGTMENILRSPDANSKSWTEEDSYDLVTDFSQKLQLIWSNAMTFNPDKHPIHMAAKSFDTICAIVLVNVLHVWPETKKYCSPERFLWTIPYPNVCPRAPLLKSPGSSFGLKRQASAQGMLKKRISSMGLGKRKGSAIGMKRQHSARSPSPVEVSPRSPTNSLFGPRKRGRPAKVSKVPLEHQILELHTGLETLNGRISYAEKLTRVLFEET